jgi:hypothetical protein
MFANKSGASLSTVSTTTTTSQASGDTTITLASTSGIAAGDSVAITGAATGNVITAISGSVATLTTPLAAAITSGVAVTVTPVVKVFNTYFAGQQALAEAVAEEFHVVIGPVVDKLMRHRPLGWYGVAGWSIYRDEALYRIESTSSIDFQ